MEYMQLSMDEYIQSKNEIKNEIYGIAKSFVRIGWQLDRIEKSEAYKLDGYENFGEFVKAECGMDRSRASRFIKVYKKCTVPGSNQEIKDQYKDFKFDTLVALLELPEEDQQIFNSDDKRTDIRELQKFNRENENNPMNLLDWKSAQSTEDKLKATIQEFFHEKQGVLNTLYSSEAYQTGNIKEMSQIINPGDSMSYRKGTAFLMFHQEDITVKIFNGEMKNITWEQFFTYTQEIFTEAAAGNRTYENYFGIIEEVSAEPEKEEIFPTTEQSVHPEPEIAPAQPEPARESVGKVDNSVDKSQETAVEEKEEPHEESTAANPDFQTPKSEPENTEKCQETAQTEPEPQIPGQDNIQNHPEYMPEPVTEQDVRPESEIAPAQSEQPAESPITRKTYIDSLTAYGTAEYLAKAMRSFANKTYNILLAPAFWERWLNEKVDHNGRPWEN